MLKSLMFFTLIFLLNSISYSQNYKKTKNVISFSLIDPFLKPNAYSLAYEHTLDKGYSPNVSQLSYKVIGSILKDSDKRVIDTFLGNEIYDLNAVDFSGFRFFTEFRYFFQWNAPEGYYFALFGGFSNENEVYTDRRENSFEGYELSSTMLTRGLGFGVQYKLSSLLSLDILGGYNVSNVNQTRIMTETNEELKLNPFTKDGLRVSASIGIMF